MSASKSNGCAHCGGTSAHEDWCLTVNADVFYAYQIAIEPESISEADALYLRALGIIWVPGKRFTLQGWV